jgi:hypothetical protein
MSNQLPRLFRAAAILIALTAAACGSNSPTSPTSGSIASVTLSGASVAPGNSIQATVALATAPGSGATVGLTSSNPGVATVPASVDIAAGATSTTFAVWGVAAGSVTITATMNGSSRQSSTLTVSSGLRLASISVTPSTTIGGSIVTGTVTLNGPAPNGGAAVTLSSDGIAVVPASVTVISGDSSATFNVLTRTVTAPTTATINGSFGGASSTATIALTQPVVATANFGVTGSHVTDTCAVISNGTALDCTFDGSASSAPGSITAYDWSWSVAGNQKTQTTSGSTLATPSFSCSMLPPAPLPATGFVTMTVTLKIHDDAGDVSAAASNGSVRLLPQGSCGY